jgi:hypothetical protein
VTMASVLPSRKLRIFTTASTASVERSAMTTLLSAPC